MKKILLLAAVAIGMVACSNEDVIKEAEGSSQITLGAVTKKASRGGLSDTQLTDGTNIYCTGLLEGNPSSFHFKDLVFTSSGSNAWINRTVNWPITGKLEFWAYTTAEYQLSKDGTTTSTTTVNDDDLVSAAFTTADNKLSTMTLDFKDQLNGANDVMVSDIVTADCATKGQQTLTFKHALAWIVVNIESTSTDLMKFTSITVDNVKTSGKLEADKALNFKWTPYRADGAAEDATQTLRLPAYDNVLIGTATNNPLTGVLVLPQDQTSITMTYAYKDKDDQYNNVQHYTINLSDASIKETGGAHLATWEAGYKYCYNIKISTDNYISFTSSVTGYTEYKYNIDK